MEIEIISRAMWGAKFADGFRNSPLPAKEVWLHHTVTSPPPNDLEKEKAAIRVVENIGQQRFSGGISYTFGVVPSGRIFTGHSVNRQGAHTAGRNDIARAIAMLGNFDIAPVPPAMIESIARLLVHGKEQGWWINARLNGGHQQAPGAATECPGRYGMQAVPVINARAAEIESGGYEMAWSEIIGRRENVGPGKASEFLQHAAVFADKAARLFDTVLPKRGNVGPGKASEFLTHAAWKADEAAENTAEILKRLDITNGLLAKLVEKEGGQV